MSAASGVVSYVIMYMGPILGFLGLSSFLIVKLVNGAARKRVARQILLFFWAGTSASFLGGLLQSMDVVSFANFQQISAMFTGGMIGAASVVFAQYATNGEHQTPALQL